MAKIDFKLENQPYPLLFSTYQDQLTHHWANARREVNEKVQVNTNLDTLRNNRKAIILLWREFIGDSIESP